MVEINLGDMGSVNVSKKLKANLNVSTDELFEQFQALVGNLSGEATALIRDAVDDGKEVKTKKQEGEIREFFNKIKAVSGTSMGFGADEMDELEESDKLKGEQMDKGTYNYGDSESGEYQTLDRDTGEAEGKVILSGGNEDGKLVPIVINESVKLYLEHDGTTSEENKVETTGFLSIENVSTKDRLWDIDLQLGDVKNTDIEEEVVSIRELASGDKEEVEYKIEGEGEQLIEITEYISTLNDPEIAAFNLVVGVENEIYAKITIKNIASENLTSIDVKKLVPEGFSDVEIVSSSIGETEEESDDDLGRVISWKIEEIEPDQEETLELRLTVSVDSIEDKARSGKISVSYVSPLSISGLKIEKFDAYTNNKFYIGTYEKDEVPDEFECQFSFENNSEYMLRLVNADVYDAENEDTKFVDIDPGEIPPLPEGSRWESNVWDVTTEEGLDPKFRSKVEFFVIADHQITTNGIIDINDLELAVAAIGGEITYDVSRLPSFKESTFYALLKVENTGGSDLNEVSVTETIQEGFKPPTEEEISIMLNGDEIEVDEGVISITPSDTESGYEHVVTVSLKDLRDQDLEAFHPGDVLEVRYPIIADKPEKSVKYVSNASYTANTYPAGQAIEFTPYTDTVEIEVVHIRRRFIKGKTINALADAGEYEITIYVRNTGKFDLENYELADKVPENFEYSDLTDDTTEVSKLEGADVLHWVIEKIEPGDVYEIKYKLTGEGKPSDAQDLM